MEYPAIMNLIIPILTIGVTYFGNIAVITLKIQKGYFGHETKSGIFRFDSK